MLFSNDYELKREQYKDFLREAERERLISRILGGREKPAVWLGIGQWLSGIFHRTESTPIDYSRAFK